MSINKVKRICTSIILAFSIQISVFAEEAGVFYDATAEQIKFAAADIQKALEDKGYTVELFPLSSLNNSYANKKVVIALATDTAITRIFLNQGGTAPSGLGEQAYALHTTTQGQTSYWVLGGDINGAMYGGLQIAENISFYGYTGTYNNQESPTIIKRGIKLNLPFDEKSPTYFSSSNGTSYKKAIPNVWDMTFWTSWLDEMARNRFNVLSIWNNHPFTSLIKMPDYPNVALQDVKGFDGFSKTMSIDEKIVFWKQVMTYAHARGFQFFFFNWNIFVSNANGQYGLSNGSASSANTTYMYKCMLQLLETYPDLDGFGITNGENGSTVDFLWNTYGKGIYDYALANPQRKFVFIHRWHQASFSGIKSLFEPLLNLPNVTFDMSFKYSEAHMYSTPVPTWWGSGNVSDLNTNGLKTWFTVRNDDYYYHNWGDPNFVRAYVNGIPGKGAYCRGFYMGSDGFCPTKSFFSKNNVQQDLLEVQRQWYMFKLWGRLSYNPATPDDVFKNFMTLKYPTVSSDSLFMSWGKASGGLPKVTELTQMELRLDFDWWPEACWSKDGFVTVNTFANADLGKGSSLCNIANSALNNCNGKKSSLQLADEIEAEAKSALSIVEGMSADANTQLGVTINNIKAMAYLSVYYAYKIRGATYLKAGTLQNSKKIAALGTAYCWWMKYSNLMDSMYYGMSMQRVSDLPNWHSVDMAVLKEYTDNGGIGIPSCSEISYLVSLSVNEGIGGTVSGEGTFKSDENVTVKATPSRGYKFDNWQEGGVIVSANKEYTFAPSQNRQLTANFSLNGWCVLPYAIPGFSVTNNKVNWSSGTLNITCAQKVNISLDVEGIGTDNSDSCNVYYKVDGGSRITLSLNAGAFTKKTVSVANVTGSAVELILEVNNSNSNNTYNISNILIVSNDKLDQIISFPALPAKKVGDADFSPGATATSGLQVVCSSSNTEVATITAEGKIHIAGLGSSTITVLQTGDANFKPATEISQILTVASGSGTSCFLPWDGNNMDISNQTLTDEKICDINISCAPKVSLSIDLEGTGGLDAGVDYLKIYYKVDGGTEINFLVYSGGNFSLYNKTVTDIKGNNLQIFVNAYNTSSLEHYLLTNIRVVAETIDQTLTFPAFSVKKVGDADFFPEVSASSGLPVTYSSSNTAVAIFTTEGKIHLVGAGTSNITASQAGDFSYHPAPEVSQLLTVTTSATGLQTLSSKDFFLKLYPNPVLNTITIEINENAKMNVFNALGKLVLSANLFKNHEIVDLSTLSQGVYFIRIISKEDVVNYNIIKQ